MEIKREWLEELIFASGDARRFTQDSPVLPDVWIRYAQLLTRGKAPVLDLLLTPHADSTAGDLYLAVERRLAYERQEGGWWQQLRAPGGYLEQVRLEAEKYEIQGARGDEERDDAPADALNPNLAYNQSTVVGSFYLHEVVRVLLPLTQWWRHNVCRDKEDCRVANLDTGDGRKVLDDALDAIVELWKKRVKWEKARRKWEAAMRKNPGQRRRPPAAPHRTKEVDRLMDLLWIVKLVGGILAAAETPDPTPDPTWEKRKQKWDEILKEEAVLVDHFRRLLLAPLPMDGKCPDLPEVVPLYMISRNRKANATITFSVQAMKADAARRVFDASCAGLAWAILDSGIDATHPAFRKRTKDQKPFPSAFEDDKGKPANGTRVDGTFDFTRIRTLLSGKSSELKKRAEETSAETLSAEEELAKEQARAKKNANKIAHLERRLKCLRDRHDSLDTYTNRVSAAESAKEIKISLLRGRSIDWSELRPFLEMEHASGIYKAPEHEHGTHVAGILA
ncbi:MAG TPA: hypothetical protein VNP72_04445, partial [Longimicrobium sp.]|nr:hypothetical protein [Longimicrobium sp.]